MIEQEKQKLEAREEFKRQEAMSVRLRCMEIAIDYCKAKSDLIDSVVEAERLFAYVYRGQVVKQK